MFLYRGFKVEHTPDGTKVTISDVKSITFWYEIDALEYLDREYPTTL